MHPPTPARCLSLLAVLALAASFLTGCESYSSPVLSVAKAEANERTPDGCSMVFTLDARNDNEDPLPLRTLEYKVALNGRDVFSGTRSAEATLRRLGSQQLRLPAVVALTPDTQALIGGRAHYRLTGSIDYVTPGRLAETLFDAGVRVPSVAFSFEGDIDLSAARETPTAAAAAPPAEPVKATP